jgi:hypothetical protein
MSTSQASTQFVLTAGPGPNGAPGGVFATFSDESAAKAAFVRQRLGSAAPDAWGRLVTVDTSGRARVLCWFGPVSRSIPTAPAVQRAAGARRQRRRAATRLTAAVGALGGGWATRKTDSQPADPGPTAA